VPRFLVESYVATSSTAFEDACGRARLTADLGGGVDYIHTTFLPGDEMVLHLFEAPSVEALAEAGRRAGLDFERIVEAVEASARSTKGDKT
jgi:hypothetical protein